MIDRIRWLHISDFHFVAAGRDDFSQRLAMRAMLDNVTTHVTDQTPISFVLVTGDVAFSGQAEEYERAGASLSALARVAGVQPDRFFFVPGNHDIDRSRHRLAWVGARSEITSQPATDRLLGNRDELSPLLERQAAFWSFARAFTGEQQRTRTDDGLAYAAQLLIGELRLAILGMNSPWLSGGDAEEMKLVMGERQVINALELAQTSSPHLQIALAHHPISWLQEWDQLTCNQRLLAGVHLYHRGHLHMTEVCLTSSPERPCLSIAAGSSHATRFYANAYNLVDLDLGIAMCTVQPFTYDPSASHYAPSPVVNAPIVLRGSLPGTRGELARAIVVSAASAQPYAGYLAGLLRGEKEEIPVQVTDVVDFLKPSVAEAMAVADVTPALEFLRLRNLLPIYGDDVPLSERLERHATTINEFVAYLSQLPSDEGSVARLTGSEIANVGESGRGAGGFPYTVEFLTTLRLRGDWPVIEIQAQPLIGSPDVEVARTAKRALAEALMHSDEAEKREEATRVGDTLAAAPDASASDFLLAAGCYESAGDDEAAVELARQGLLRWPGDSDLRQYARQLALRAGRPDLRTAVEKAATGQQTT